jgi:predicted N-acetyltransferase YhbS
MQVEYTTAKLQDYDELIDLANYVFSHRHGPTDFPSVLPKLYRREYFMESIHYIVKEDGKIRAIVGAYPLSLNVLGSVLPGRGIGMVSVHPYTRSHGYMRALMQNALEDMRRDHLVFGCLGGLRQRYEYFGFTPTGTLPVFDCRRLNIRHTQAAREKMTPKKNPAPPFSIRQLNANDTQLLDAIYQYHQSKPARIERRREKFFDIISSWKNRVCAILEGNAFAGYLIYSDGDNEITEINLIENACLPEALVCFLDHLGKKEDRDRIFVIAQPQETSKLEILSSFTEDCRVSSAYSFTVFDFIPFISAFLNLKAAGQSLPEGSAVLRIEPEQQGAPAVSFRIAVNGGKAQVSSETSAEASAPDIALGHLEALRLFFSPETSLVSPILRANPFLASIFPLPLFFEKPDGI